MAGGTVIVNIVGNSAQLTAVLNKAAGDLDGFAGKMQRTSQKMINTGKGLTLGLSVPIAGLGFFAFKAASDFETAFAGVTKTVAGTKKQMDTLRQGIIDMSKEIPSTTTEIAAVAEAAGALGISTDHVLEFTRVMIDLGNTTNLTAEDAANAFARIANILQIPQDQFDEMGSTVVDLGNKSAATESEITEMALRIAGAGRQVGLTADQVLGFGAALASVGIDAEAGGTAISRTFVEINNAVSDGGEALAGFATIAGTSAEEFGEKFRTDAAGAFTDFIAGLQNIKASGGDVLTTLDNLGITEIRQRDAILRLVGAGDLLNTSLDTAKTAWDDNNALQDESSKRYETTASRMQILKNRIADAARVLGETLIPIVEKVVGWIAKFAKKFQDLDPDLQKAIIAAGLFAAALGPVVVIIGLLLNPITWVVIAITGIATALYLLWTRWDEIWGWIKDHPAIAIIIGILGAPILIPLFTIIAVAKRVAENWDSIWGAIKVAIEIAKGVIEGAINIINGAIDGVLFVLGILKGIWDEVWGALGGAVDRAWDALQGPLGLIRGAVDGIIGAVRTVKDLLSDLTATAVGNGVPLAGGDTFYADPTRRRASGGPVWPGTWLVGEQGPELLTIGGSGHVTNARDTAAALTGSQMTNHFTIYTNDPERAARATVRRLRTAEYLASL
jgi:TP901 family phage tail tape measure protein